MRRAWVRGEFGTPKSKRSSRGTPLAMRVAGGLDELFRKSLYRGDDDLVFGHPHTGKPLDRSQVLKRFKRYCKAAGIGEQRFHDLRHTFGTHMAASGQVSLRRLQEWFGHARISTTEIYADFMPSRRTSIAPDRMPDPPSSARTRTRAGSCGSCGMNATSPGGVMSYFAGRPGKCRCRRARGRRVCRRRLAIKPRLRVGRAALLRGRLTVNRKAMAGAAVEVWRQLDGGADWKRLGTVTTSRTGRFGFKARRGPARTIRFRYPGGAMIRGRNADVRLRVRASTSMAVSRRSVVTGEYVTFRGQLRGGWLPTDGVLVELQVFTRGKWRTFAQPRASGTNGRWEYQYRFETIRGRAQLRFRARIRRQRGYPFTTGHSRFVQVRVRGL